MHGKCSYRAASLHRTLSTTHTRHLDPFFTPPSIMSDESKSAGNQEWQLASHPEADVTVDHMALVSVETPDEVSSDGNVIIKLNFLSVDPYMRGQCLADGRLRGAKCWER